MGKKSLSSGLDGWIKETKKSHDRLSDGQPASQAPASAPASPPAPAAPAPVSPEAPSPSVELVSLALDALEVPPAPFSFSSSDELDTLTRSISEHGLWQPLVARTGSEKPVLVTGYRRLAALRALGVDEAPVLLHAELSDEDAGRLYVADNLHRFRHSEDLATAVEAHGAENLVRWGVPEAWIDSATAGNAAPESTRPTALKDGIVAVDDQNFEQEVLDSDRPVLLGFHLPGLLGSDEMQDALLEARQHWGDQLKICAFDILENDGPALPQLVRVGRDFLDKHLPRVQLYAAGRRRRELASAADAHEIDREQLADLLQRELG